ncbi:TonB family protein [Sulfurimonas sp.]
MNRYLSSFIISSIFYFAIILSIIYLVNFDSKCSADTKMQIIKEVHVSVITQVASQKQKQKIKEEKKVKPKPKTKPKPKPKPIPQPVKEEPISEPFEEPVKEKTTDENVEPVEEVAKVVDTTTETKSEINSAVIAVKRDIFIADLIKRINSNKSYPNMARRRHIEGIVDVRFKILMDGNVNDIEITSGRKIFRRSAIQAIDKSFPIDIDTSIFDFPKEFKIKIAYILK